MDVNRKMLSRAYLFQKDEVHEYVDAVLSVRIEAILEFVRNDIDMPVVTEDIFQFSSVADVTCRICQRLAEAGDPVVDAPSLGEILLNDGVKRNDIANRKYGENHGKMAARIGLVQIVEKHFLLSCLGKIFMERSVENRQRLIVRLLLRTPLIGHLLRINRGDIDMRQVMCELSDSTYMRRRSSVRNMLQFLQQSDEFDFSAFLSRLNFA